MNFKNGQLKDAEQNIGGIGGEARIMSKHQKGDVHQTIPSGDRILRTISEANVTRPSVWNVHDKNHHH